jgi:hypothetical protein
MFTRALQAWGRMLGFGSASGSSEEERRAWGRSPCDVPTRIRPASGAEATWSNVRVRNVSQGGIGLQADTPYTPGSLLSVRVPGDEAEVLACVVRCDSLSTGYSVGCTFAAVLDDADLARFGARRAPAGEGDQRLWRRFPCKAQAFLQKVRDRGSAPVRAAVVRDISAGGIAVEAEADLQVGDLVQIDLIRDDEALFCTLASVVRIGPAEEGQGRLIGANFIGELSEERLALLLE